MATNQREATVNAVLAVLQERGINYVLNGEISVSEVLTRADKEKVKDILVSGFNSETIEMSTEGKQKYLNKKELNSYVSGLINNWVRKFSGFNGGEKYTAKNPGIRTGSTDEQIKEMRKLLKTTNDAKAKTLIEQAIQARIAEIKPKNEVQIDLDKLPEDLRAALGIE